MSDQSKIVFDAALNYSEPKINEVTVKELTGLNLGQIKEAKKWLKDKGLIQSFRGRGGYFSVIDGAVWPEEEKAVNKLSKSENLAAAREAKKAKHRELAEFESHRERIRAHVRKEVETLSEVPDEDFDFNWCGEDEYIVVVWRQGTGSRYRCFANEL